MVNFEVYVKLTKTKYNKGCIMDINVECEKGKFKLRASGVIVKDGKMLVDRARRFDGFIFLGGHVEVGETCKDAILRESREELGFETKIIKLICINENIYPVPNTEMVAHEISYYYLLEPKVDIEVKDFEYVEVDKGNEITHYYQWIDINSANDYNIRPNWVADMILQGRENYYYLTDQTKD